MCIFLIEISLCHFEGLKLYNTHQLSSVSNDKSVYYYEFTMHHRLPNNSFHLVPGVQVCKFESVLSDYGPSFNHFRVAERAPDVRNSAKRANSQISSQQGKLLWFLFCIIQFVQYTSI